MHSSFVIREGYSKKPAQLNWNEAKTVLYMWGKVLTNKEKEKKNHKTGKEKTNKHYRKNPKRLQIWTENVQAFLRMYDEQYCIFIPTQLLYCID